MPNWCENDLLISGKKADVEKVLEHLKGENGIIDFNKVIPYPDKYKKLDEIAAQYMKENPKDYDNCPKDGYNSGGYEWCTDNWGTKWNATIDKGADWDWECDDEEYTCVTQSFDTAWSPPVAIIEKLLETHPDVVIEMHYYEQGCQFQGCINRSGNSCFDYHGNRGG